MTPKAQVDIALRGGKPAYVPIVPIYDFGYVMHSIDRDVREYLTAGGAERVQLIEENFLRHREVDGFFVHAGTNDDYRNAYRIDKVCHEYWLITDKATGAAFRLLPDGCRAEADGTPIARNPSAGGISKIQSARDIEGAVAIPSPAQIEASGRMAPLRHLAQKYPEIHFSFQTGSPMVHALNACGGYEEGLTLMATRPELYRELLARCAAHQCACMRPGREAGGLSTWFTSYYTGADTIAPRDYAELVFPFDYEVCRAAKDQGLFVLNWFLGDLMPILDKVRELPIDALVLEQGRKTYEIDPVAIRKRVGSRFCLFGFGFENDYCIGNRAGLAREIRRQIEGAGREGAFIAGTPIMPPNADPATVDFYFREVRRLGTYPLPQR